MEAVHRIEQLLADIVPETRFEMDAGFLHATPLAARLLAFVGGESREVLLEVAVVLIGPVKLAVTPQQPAGRLECRARRLIAEQRVR